MPYNYILDIDLLPRFAGMLSGSVVIFDEAQNVPEASCEGRSYDMMLANIVGALAEVEKMFRSHVSTELKNVRKENEEFLNRTKDFLIELKNHNLDFIQAIDFSVIPNEAEKIYYAEEGGTAIKVVHSSLT